MTVFHKTVYLKILINMLFNTGRENNILKMFKQTNTNCVVPCHFTAYSFSIYIMEMDYEFVDWIMRLLDFTNISTFILM